MLSITQRGRRYIDLDSVDSILYELEALINIFKGVEVGAISARLEAILSKLVSCDLLP